MAKKQIHIGSSTVNKLYAGSTEVQKVYVGANLVYENLSAHTVTYHIDTNNVVTQDVADGEDCIANAPSVSVSGYTLHGWREDTTASSTVLSTKTCDQDGIHLYAVLKQTITASYNGNGNTGGSTAASTGTKYYNNGNVANPSITLRSNGFSKTDYTFGRWSMGSTSGTKYKAGASVTLSSDTTFYAFWVVTATTYRYEAKIRPFTALVPGTYKLEVYGSSGGSATGATGGKGGYSVGNVSLTEDQTIYVCAGGLGSSSAGGYNGGGSPSGQSGSKGGGGATHIGKSNALLKDTAKANLYIVAGGGGGGYYNNGTGCAGGAGGGTSGGNVTFEGVTKTGGTQSTGYAYGVGAPSSVSYTSGGGGGLYGGNNGYGAGAGGSGYIGGVSSGSTTAGQRSGAGYATITLVTVS